MGEDEDNGAAVAGAAIAAQLIGSTVQNGANLFASAKQREWSEAMLERQNQWSLDQWNRTNEYNSPSAQVQRMREAGLNPLYYGLDGSSANAFQSATPLGYERATFGGFGNPIAAGVDAAVKVAQVSNLQADTAKKSQETQTEVARREKMLADIDLARQDLKNKLASEALTDAQRQQIEKSISWMDRLNEAVLSEKKSNAALNESTKKRIDALLAGEQILQAKSIEDFEHRWAKIDAEIEKIGHESDLMVEDLQNYALNHMQSGVFGAGVSVPNILRFFLEAAERYQDKSSPGSRSGVR